MSFYTIKINEEEFIELKDIIYNYSGIMLNKNKKYLVESRLSERVLELNFTTFKEYISYLKYNINKFTELRTLINLITINETYFFREKSQIDHLISHIVPDLIAKGKEHIRIWSAPCSTGEEPYSIAILLYDAGLFQKAKIEIIATDINSDSITMAKKGEYKKPSFRGVPVYFMRNFNKSYTSYFIKQDIKKYVTFNVGNIINPFITTSIGNVDIIFCRNLLIYFDIKSKQKAIKNFYNMLNDPGYLFLGHSEILNNVSEDFVFQNLGNCIMYKKK